MELAFCLVVMLAKLFFVHPSKLIKAVKHPRMKPSRGRVSQPHFGSELASKLRSWLQEVDWGQYTRGVRNTAHD